MLNKLLKYDLKWIYKVLIVFYFLSLIFAVIARILSSIENSAIFDVLGKVAAGFAVSMVVSALINCIMRSWARFTINMYKDESYLTHTLPVSKDTVYLSKVLSAILCTFTTVAISVGCMFICYYSDANMKALKNSLSVAADTFDTTVINLLLIVSAVILMEVFFILIIGYAGIVIGHRSNKNKLLKSIIAGIVMYLMSNVLSVAVLFAAGTVNDNIMNLFKTTDSIQIATIKSVMYIAISIYFIYNVAFYFIGKQQLNKGINID